MSSRTSTSVRLDEEQLARLDRIVAAMRERLAGLDVGRAAALRLALERGMALLDRELGIAEGVRRSRPNRGRASPRKPATTKPATTKPASTRPASTKPASTKPASTKPASTARRRAKSPGR